MLLRRPWTLLARLVLAWFVLHVGTGIAAPWLQPQGFELVCAGGSLKLLDAGEEGAALAAPMECPLCSPAIAPPPALRQGERAAPVLLPAPPLRSATLPPPAHAPPPARGPPGPAIA